MFVCNKISVYVLAFISVCVLSLRDVYTCVFVCPCGCVRAANAAALPQVGAVGTVISDQSVWDSLGNAVKSGADLTRTMQHPTL